MNGHQKQRETSKRMIESALFALMEEMEFSQITVCRIVERADVARKTFYRLYHNKEDVMCQYFADLCNAYQASCRKLAHYDLRRIAEDYFGFWHQHRKLLLLLHRCGMDQMLYYEMTRVSMQIVKMRMEDGGLDGKPGMAEPLDLPEWTDLPEQLGITARTELAEPLDSDERPELAYFADYSVGGFVNLLHRWVRSGMRETPGEYAQKVGDAILKFSGGAFR